MSVYDSDDSEFSDYESNVHLGLPDGGPISDLDDKTIEISRIGGQPSFPRLRNLPSTSSNLCKVCNNNMELLLQIFAPYPDSVNDRVLFFFACSRASCQKKDGSVRAFRCLSRNEKWARKLAKLKQRDQEKKKKQAEEDKKAKEQATTNPFTAGKSNPFSQTTGAFGADDSDSESEEEQPRFKKIIESDSEESSEDEDEGLEAELAKLEISDGGVAPTKQYWPEQPSYATQYIATTPEVIPKPSKDSKVKIEDVKQTLQGAGGNSELEEFEKSMGNGMDEAFEHFIKHVNYEPQQCIRYELGGTPLAYTNKDGVYKKLFGGANEASVANYDTAKLPRCETCGSKRVFECQITPNIINLCNNTTQNNNLSEEERKKELEEALAGKSKGSTKADMEWGTIMLFVCENDCCLESGSQSKEAREQWIEELAYVQWE
ncbi:hypothetical protein E3Q22_02065 [Wallemia mellicola]|uniref:Programmed cell death protein 2 C-terminal domain-containing protein n=1 Tax=Wallemia mellicola TaxID=1708541 RepID=A0A4T0TXI1_9BASI|nr:hypothetical protein E3Q22_02065 [Wallemia mellicola]TIB88328.1 hypothetical protein E3Q21_01005 [Wallemia mellicola]TIB91201.1 hypothetical protein E3Q20_00992 [Wallemia mellicola]TIC26333.1 hypothetical protein E3Q12_00322 [Wallemia mellicola]TIC40676.1 hypothetical protein E3Q07_02040 [Wallemia mellicola]